jgi:hypothetical protein
LAKSKSGNLRTKSKCSSTHQKGPTTPVKRLYQGTVASGKKTVRPRGDSKLNKTPTHAQHQQEDKSSKKPKNSVVTFEEFFSKSQDQFNKLLKDDKEIAVRKVFV